MRALLFVTSFLFLTSFQIEGRDSNGFYDYKGSGKVITKISKMLVSDSPNFNFGFQSYSNHEIDNSVSFYNQPSDILHYVLTTKTNRSLHFEVPILSVKSFQTLSVGTDVNGRPQPRLEVQCLEEQGIKVKEHNEKGGIIFSLKFSSYQIPLPQGTDLDKLQKQCDKLLKKGARFKMAS